MKKSKKKKLEPTAELLYALNNVGNDLDFSELVLRFTFGLRCPNCHSYHEAEGNDATIFYDLIALQLGVRV